MNIDGGNFTSPPSSGCGGTDSAPKEECQQEACEKASNVGHVSHSSRIGGFVGVDNSQLTPFRALLPQFPSYFFGCSTGPTPHSMRERADVLVTKQPSDL